ncbi:MAG: transposase [Gammaproteobacteria bacterium]|nr:transposase [Gammaproteobacteria bacterium]
MPRKPRFHLPGVPVHLIQRGNNREPAFFDIADYQAYLRDLGEASRRYCVAVHAWVLMTNHVHLLATPVGQDSLALMMQWLGARYVRYINHSYRRTGSLWEGRYKGCLVDSDRYLLNCMCYIETNPLRAGMVESPADYRWSSYHCNAFGSVDRLTQPHPLYTALGEDAEVRQRVYRGLFLGRGDPTLIDEIRAATHTGTPLGNDRFREKIEAALGRAVGQSVRGRPKKLDVAR